MSVTWDNDSSSSSSEEGSPHDHELNFARVGRDSFEVTSSNFSQRDGRRIGRLILTHNRLTVLPTKLSIFKNLRQLDISNNQMEVISPEILKLTNLRVLIAKNNRLTADGIPKDLGVLSDLELINLGGNPLGRIPDVLLSMRSIRHLQFGSCELREVPKNINQLISLETLYLGGNLLASVPEEIGYLENLRALHLNDNQIQTLPSSLSNLYRLLALSLHRNRLSSLPSEIIRLDNLRELSLRDNPLIRHFIRYLVFQPASLLELAARVIKASGVLYDNRLPPKLVNYLDSAHQCVNMRCRGVYFDSRLEHVKFVDFCGKYKVPFMEYLCSPRCVPTLHPELNGPMNEAEASMIRKVLLG